jgi:hypothetical protein
MKLQLGVDRKTHAPLATALSGATATIVNDAVMTPGDVIKQRLQLASSPYKGISDCIRQTYRAEGFRAFYRSYKTTVTSFNGVFSPLAYTLPSFTSSTCFRAHVLAWLAEWLGTPTSPGLVAREEIVMCPAFNVQLAQET